MHLEILSKFCLAADLHFSSLILEKAIESTSDVLFVNFFSYCLKDLPSQFLKKSFSNYYGYFFDILKEISPVPLGNSAGNFLNIFFLKFLRVCDVLRRVFQCLWTFLGEYHRQFIWKIGSISSLRHFFFWEKDNSLCKSFANSLSNPDWVFPNF